MNTKQCGDFKNSAKSVFEFSVYNIHGEEVKLSKYAGHVCIFVNVASESPFTDHNYRVLNSLHDRFAEERGLRILAFPCNQFGLEEPGSAKDIAAFTAARGVRFDVLEKTRVNGDKASPVWKFLKKNLNTGNVQVITSNFTKFIVNKAGNPACRLGPGASEEEIVKALEVYY